MSVRNGTAKEAQRFFGEKIAKAMDRDAAIANEQARLRQVLDENSARLRGLRLAKEAADKTAAELASAPKKRRPAVSTKD